MAGSISTRAANFFLTAEPGCLAHQVPAFGQAGGKAGGLTVIAQRTGEVTAHFQQVRTGGVQPVVSSQFPAGYQLTHDLQARLRTGHHRDGDCPVEADYRSRCEPLEHLVEPEHFGPVGTLD